MYQFYYAEKQVSERPQYRQSLENVFHVSSIRPTMWEEHCLECAAPLCFQNCEQYAARSDGRCKRFSNGIEVSENHKGCCGQAARIKFRPWGNMMSIVFPSMLTSAEYQDLTKKNQRLGSFLHSVIKARQPVKLRWGTVRTIEYIRRRRLRSMTGANKEPDAFVFHGYSFEKESFRLVLEVYNGQKPCFKTSFELQPGENLFILEKKELSPECWRPNNLVKIYPENNLEAELEILWCDFVQGELIQQEKPAEKVKCVVWDLDHTLWDGILIECDDPKQLALRPGVEELIRALDERGILQSIASKNDFQAAWPVIQRLGLEEYFLYPQINWGDKSASMRAIAEALNIGVDSLVLIDDSAFERGQVQSVLPCVRCYEETQIPGLLSRKEFEIPVTAESRNRRAMYRAEEKRNLIKAADHSDTISFLKKCDLRVRVFSPETDGEILRCYELVNRTNQLNMTGRKYSREEFQQALEQKNVSSFAFACGDNFGEYGIVGFGQYRVENGRLLMKEFAMSCRVAGKYVESAFFSSLLEREACDIGEMTVVKTKKNILLRRTLDEAGFRTQTDSPESLVLTFDKDLKNKELVKVSFEG